jgi:hypothetical protein
MRTSREECQAAILSLLVTVGGWGAYQSALASNSDCMALPDRAAGLDQATGRQDKLRARTCTTPILSAQLTAPAQPANPGTTSEPSAEGSSQPLDGAANGAIAAPVTGPNVLEQDQQPPAATTLSPPSTNPPPTSAAPEAPIYYSACDDEKAACYRAISRIPVEKRDSSQTGACESAYSQCRYQYRRAAPQAAPGAIGSPAAGGATPQMAPPTPAAATTIPETPDARQYYSACDDEKAACYRAISRIPVEKRDSGQTGACESAYSQCRGAHASQSATIPPARGIAATAPPAAVPSATPPASQTQVGKRTPECELLRNANESRALLQRDAAAWKRLNSSC